LFFVVLVALLLLPGIGAAADDTLIGALARAYQHNPMLNAERARQRGTDENVPIALAGYRPQVNLSLSPSLIAVRALTFEGEREAATLRGYTAQAMINQTLFNGFKTGNQVRQSEASVRAGRETLRGVEQSVLLDAVTAYGNVLANQALVEAQRANVAFLRETIAATRQRLQAGDVTPTDLAQTEARLSRALADLNTAEVNLAVSRAAYRQVIGVRPGRLAPTEPIDRLLPRTEDEAVAAARRENPAVLSSTYEVDVAQFAIKVAESALYPTINVQGTLMRQDNADPLLIMRRMDQASLVGQLNLPIYDGGACHRPGPPSKGNAVANPYRARPRSSSDGGGGDRRLGNE
jgi:outer membrane protein